MKTSLFPVLLLTLASSACVRYSYNGQPYWTKSEMLAAQKKHQAELLARVEPRAQALAPTCRAVLPNRAVVKSYGVLKTSDNVSAAMVDAVAEAAYNDDLFLTDVIRKRHICQTLTIEIGNGKTVQPRESELLIYLHMPELDTADWYVQRAGQKRLLVLFDTRILDINKRLRDWLLRLETKIHLLDGASGETPKAVSVGG